MNVKMYLVVCILTVSLFLSGYASNQMVNATPTPSTILITDTASPSLETTPTGTPKPVASIEINPDATATAAAQQTMDPRKYNARADGYYAKEKYAEAISDYIHALEADPKYQADAEVLKRAASSLAGGTACDLVEAVDTLAQLPGAQKIVQKSLPMVLYECGQAQKNAGAFADARKTFQRILDEFPSSNMKKNAETGLMEVDWVELVKTKGIAVAAEQVCSENDHKKLKVDPFIPKPYRVYISGKDEWRELFPSPLLGEENSSLVICISQKYEYVMETCPYTDFHFLERIKLSRFVQFINPITGHPLYPSDKINGTSPDKCHYEESFKSGEITKRIYGTEPEFSQFMEYIKKKIPSFAKATLSAFDKNTQVATISMSIQSTSTQTAAATLNAHSSVKQTEDAILRNGAAQTTIPGIKMKVNRKDDAEIVFVPAGEFMMGSDNGAEDEMPEHTIYLDDYWIYKNEVTNAQYMQCAFSNVCFPPYCDRYKLSDCNYRKEGYEKHPVMVNWEEAKTYCEWAGGRLPTEAEWEKAARGTDGREYPWGNDEPTCELANFYLGNHEYCVGSTTVVGSYPKGASPFGVMDMAGNAWEWVSDWYSNVYYNNSAKENPLGSVSGLYRVGRGGDWRYLSYFTRTTYRGNLCPDCSSNEFGFRCVVND